MIIIMRKKGNVLKLGFWATLLASTLAVKYYPKESEQAIEQIKKTTKYAARAAYSAADAFHPDFIPYEDFKPGDEKKLLPYKQSYTDRHVVDLNGDKLNDFVFFGGCYSNKPDAHAAIINSDEKGYRRIELPVDCTFHDSDIVVRKGKPELLLFSGKWDEFAKLHIYRWENGTYVKRETYIDEYALEAAQDDDTEALKYMWGKNVECASIAVIKKLPRSILPFIFDRYDAYYSDVIAHNIIDYFVGESKAFGYGKNAGDGKRVTAEPLGLATYDQRRYIADFLKEVLMYGRFDNQPESSKDRFNKAALLLHNLRDPYSMSVKNDLKALAREGKIYDRTISAHILSDF